MENCFAACGCCDNSDGITKADFDRFTDKIENVLNDEKGRKLFRNYMYTCKMQDGRRKLDFWERTEKLITHKESIAGAASSSHNREYLKDVDNLMDKAERIEELDFATMERLTIARDSENKEEITESLKVLKEETTKALRREYSAFRRHFIPNK